MTSKRILFGSLFAIGLFLFIQLNMLNNLSYGWLQPAQKYQPSSDFLFPDMGCSVIYASDGEVALGGNNEDYSNPFTMAWFLPPEEGKFGRVYFGYDGFIWGGGMNDQGLFFDALAIDQPMSVSRDGKSSYNGSLPDKAMTECATVDCVIDLFSEYHEYDTWYHQFMFGDADGNSVIVEPNQFLRNDENFQVATNFYQSQTNIPNCSTCNRYLTATSMFENASEFSVELIRDILDAVHIDEYSPTLYSTVYDLKERLIYLYHFHDYENVMVFQLDEELAKGYHAHVLADFFPENESFLNWAKPELDRIEALKTAYQPIDMDTGLYEAFVGDYKLPPEMGLPYPFYAIAIENGTLFLKIKTDKAWLELSPLSAISFYHVSSFSQFEVTFIQEEDGQVNQFIYEENGIEYALTRIKDQDTEPTTATSSATSTITATNTSTPLPPTPSPSSTFTEVPTSTDEPQATLLLTLEISKTPHTVQPTPSPPLEKSTNLSYWLVLPVLGFVILVSWLLIRKRNM